MTLPCDSTLDWVAVLIDEHADRPRSRKGRAQELFFSWNHCDVYLQSSFDPDLAGIYLCDWQYLVHVLIEEIDNAIFG